MTALTNLSPAPNTLNDLSPFRHHLDTYYAPTADELVQLGDLVAAQQANIDNIDTEIEKLKEQITRLEERKEPISNFVVKHTALMSPIRRLSLEVLQEIFIHCLNPDKSAGSMHLADAPTVLTLVCKSWREAALGTPSLWCDAHIPIHGLTDEAAIASNIAGIKAWLSRSKSLPLSICVIELFSEFTYPGTMPNRGKEFSSAVFDALYSHVARWQHLHLVTTRQGGEQYFRIPTVDLQSLRSVRLQTNTTAATEEESIEAFRSFSSAGFFHCRTLRDFSVVSPIIPRAQSILSLPIPWGNLASLTLGGAALIADVPRFLDLLSSSRNTVLEKIRFEIGHFGPYSIATSSGMSPELGKVLTFPRLRTMEIVERVHTPWLGRVIRCPVLQELEYHSLKPGYSIRQNHTVFSQQGAPIYLIDPADTETTPLETSFTSIVAHSGAFIHTLTFDPSLYTSSQILAALSSCPNLHTLVMAHAHNRAPSQVPHLRQAFTEALLEAFISPPTSMSSGEVLCPLLSTFICHGVGSFTLEDFVAFLRMKQSGLLTGVEKLRRTMVGFPESVKNDPGLHQEAISLIPGGSLNAALVFIEMPSVPLRPSLRDGLWQVPEQKGWHSFRHDQYFDH